jgi:hypothetical protein
MTSTDKNDDVGHYGVKTADEMDEERKHQVRVPD